MFTRRRSFPALAASAALFALSLAPAAYASGGNSGGVNSGGGSPATQTCAPVSPLTNQVGYYRQWAAVWSSFTVTSCASGTHGSWDVSFHNDATGQIDYEASGYWAVAGVPYNVTVDDDFGPFSTPYTVTLTVTDNNGLTTVRTASATTKAPKSPGGA